MLVALGSSANAPAVLVVLDVHLAAVQVNGCPALLELVEVGGHRHNGVAGGSLTLGGMAVAEAGSAAEAVDLVQVEEARLASGKGVSIF